MKFNSNMKSKLNVIFVFSLIVFFSCSKEKIDDPTLITEDYSASLKAATLSTFYETEPNNSMSQADVLLNNDVQIAGSINPYLDNDWFKISCIKSESIKFNLSGTGYWGVNIHDSNGNFVIGYNKGQEYIFNPTYTGNYYLVVGGTGGTYTVNLSSNGIIESEPNNTFGTADELLTAGKRCNGIVNSGSDVDYFKIQIPTTGPVTLYLKGSSQFVNATIYNSSYQVVNNLLENQALTWYSAVAGTYYVGISGYSNVSYNFYFDPPYSFVNSKYYYIGPNYSLLEYVSYKSSSISFRSEPQSDIIWADSFGFPEMYWYRLPEYNYDTIILLVDGKYSNGFPILRLGLIVGK